MFKEAGLIKNILFSNFKRLKMPYKITFALTYRCNLRCSICNIWKNRHREELSLDEIEKVFRNLNNIRWLDLTGGELTLRDDLFMLVQSIIENSRHLLVLHISTNGQLPQKAFLLAKEVIKYNVMPIINISIDGPRHINDKLRGVEGAYSKSLETFKLLKSLPKGHYYLSCTISSYNIGYIDELISELKSKNGSLSNADLHFNIFHKSAHYYMNEEMGGSSNIDFSKVKKYLALTKEGGFIKCFLESEYLKGATEYFENNISYRSCQAFRSTCFINPYGEVYPCGIYNKSAGSLKESGYDLSKIWHSTDALAIRESIDNKTCPGCWSPCEAYPAILGSLLRAEK